MGRIRTSDTEINRIIGARIRALRLEKGLTQTDVADTLAISFQQFQKYEKGANRMTVETLQRIAEFLGVPARMMLDPLEGASSEADAGLLTPDNIKILHDLGTITDPAVKGTIVSLVEAVAKARALEPSTGSDRDGWPSRHVAACS